MKRLFSMVLGMLALALSLVGNAQAALDLSGVSVDVEPVFALASIILVAIGSIWGIKKVIKLANRS